MSPSLTPYVGLPWREKGSSLDGVSCWGLAILVYRELLGVELPSYADRFVSTAERAEIATILAAAPQRWPWQAIPTGGERLFDIAIFNRGGIGAHVGIVSGPGRMLHITSGQDSCIVSHRDGRWAPRLAGFYRHAEVVA